MRPTRLSISAVVRQSRSGARNHRGCLGLLDSDSFFLNLTKGGILPATPHDSENPDVQVTKTNSESLGKQTVDNHIVLALEHTLNLSRVSRRKQSVIDQIRSPSSSGSSSSSAAVATLYHPEPIPKSTASGNSALATAFGPEIRGPPQNGLDSDPPTLRMHLP